MKAQILLRAKPVCIKNSVGQGYLEFQRVLSVNPAYLPARLIMANLQSQSGRTDLAKAILLDGLNYGMNLNQLNMLKQQIKRYP